MTTLEELDPKWRKSSESTASDSCVEVGFLNDRVIVRDSKHRDGPELEFSHEEWSAFLVGIAKGEFNIPSGS